MGFLDDFLKRVSAPGQMLAGNQGDRHSDPSYSANIEAIEKILNSHKVERANFLAAFALLLGRIAYADSEISEKEHLRMKSLLQKELGLSEADSQAVSDLAIESTIQNQSESHIVVRTVKENSSREERERVLRVLFLLAAEDDISEVESDEISLISKGLGFSRQEYLGFRSEYREHLSILK